MKNPQELLARLRERGDGRTGDRTSEMTPEQRQRYEANLAKCKERQASELWA